MYRFRIYTASLILLSALFLNFNMITNRFISMPQVEPFIYIYSIILIGLVCSSPFIQHIRLSRLLCYNVIFIILGKWLLHSSSPMMRGMHAYLTIIELLTLSLLLFLSYKLSQKIYSFEQAVQHLSFGDHLFTPLPSIDDSMSDIQAHMHSSRRYTTPLSVVVIEPHPDSLHTLIQHALHKAHRTLQNHCSLTQLSTILKPELRRTDLIVAHPQYDRLLIVCPKTSPEDLHTLTNRLQATTEENHITAHFGYASFPEEAFTFEELVLQAEAQLYSETLPEPLIAHPEPAPAHVESVMLVDAEPSVK